VSTSAKYPFKPSVIRRGGHALRAMVQAINSPVNTNGYRVGWPTKSRYKRPGGGTVGTGMVAKYLEYGFTNTLLGVDVPERPFFRTANKNFIPTLRAQLDLARIRSTNLMPTPADLAKIGQAHADRVRLEIERAAPPDYDANTPFTAKKKGHAKPLWETGQMARDVTYELTKKI